MSQERGKGKYVKKLRPANTRSDKIINEHRTVEKGRIIK